MRSDRGPEMTNRISEEFLAICNAKHVLGAALTPRHQGLCERNHQVVMNNQLILMQAVTCAHPQEWPSLIPDVEYVQHTAPQGAYGFSAHDMSSAYSIVSESDACLVPFLVPQGLPDSDAVAKLFSNFKSIYGTFTRVNREEASIAALRTVNQNRTVRCFEPGETVFRRMPKGSRLPKHMFPPPNRGPYVVVEQPDNFGLVLKDPTTGSLVDSGRKIPFDQILAGPRRARLQFAEEEENEVRHISKMIEVTRLADGTMSSGFRAGKRLGWGPLVGGCLVAYQTILNGPEQKKLSVGRVLINDRDKPMLVLLPYSGQWSGVKAVHRPYFQTPNGYTATPGPEVAKQSVRYEALVSQVKLMSGGELSHSCARRLSEGGWGLLVEENESLRWLCEIRQDGKERVLMLAQGNGCSFPSLPGTGSSPGGMSTYMGNTLESWTKASGGRRFDLSGTALQYLMFGHRVALMELFSGNLLVGGGCQGS